MGSASIELLHWVRQVQIHTAFADGAAPGDWVCLHSLR